MQRRTIDKKQLELKMEISSSLNTITVKGNIKALSHYEAIKREIENIVNNTPDTATIKILILESISITSSIIGYLCKLVDEGLHLEIHVQNEGLHNLLDDLNLVPLLNVKKLSMH
ncbi:hypothetical protein FJR45_07310 [Sulfurimonas sediminis]|uniref:STAS domain-containing protein n=1 Tax=Sulfurimonas sediminis TaxID=2590020 RepID=A0A7M1B1W8_9BACT|nr:hypothetical protein [Sulfurimonas sediminis]QOP43767.1 hypothetical protein FJR45_07310 [Sulfurimonas sediminis]